LIGGCFHDARLGKIAATSTPGEEDSMKRLVVLGTLAAGFAFAGGAAAINDPFVPGDNCAPDNAQAVGHPAAPVLAGTPAGAPGPGNADVGLQHLKAAPDCTNAG
jgi:hypothetical protein